LNCRLIMFVNKRVVLEQMEFNSAPNTTGASAPAPNQPQVAQQPAQLPFPFDSNAINPQAFIAFMQSLSVQSTPGASPSSGTFSQTATGNTVTQSLLVPAAPAPKAGTTEKAFTGLESVIAYVNSVRGLDYKKAAADAARKCSFLVDKAGLKVPKNPRYIWDGIELSDSKAYLFRGFQCSMENEAIARHHPSVFEKGAEEGSTTVTLRGFGASRGDTPSHALVTLQVGTGDNFWMQVPFKDLINLPTDSVKRSVKINLDVFGTEAVEDMDKYLTKPAAIVVADDTSDIPAQLRTAAEYLGAMPLELPQEEATYRQARASYSHGLAVLRTAYDGLSDLATSSLLLDRIDQVDATVNSVLTFVSGASNASALFTRHGLRENKVAVQDAIKEEKKTSGSRPFVCPVSGCGKDFTGQAYLKGHLSKTHGVSS